MGLKLDREERAFHEEMREQMRDLKSVADRTSVNVNRLHSTMSALEQWRKDHEEKVTGMQQDISHNRDEVKELQSVKNKLYGAITVITLAIGSIVSKLVEFLSSSSK